MKHARGIVALTTLGLLAVSPALADDHEDRYGPVVIGEESSQSTNWTDLYAEWGWDRADGSVDYVYLQAYDVGSELWIAAGTGSCDGPEYENCTTADEFLDQAPRSTLDIDFAAGTARFDWSRVIGDVVVCDIDVTMSFEPDDSEPTASGRPHPVLRDEGVGLRRSGNRTKYGEGVPSGPVCDWIGDEPADSALGAVWATEHRSETTYIELRPES